MEGVVLCSASQHEQHYLEIGVWVEFGMMKEVVMVVTMMKIMVMVMIKEKMKMIIM